MPMNTTQLGRNGDATDTAPVCGPWIAMPSPALLPRSQLPRTFTVDPGTMSIPSPVVSPALREIGFGEWEALSWSEIESRNRDYARLWSDSYPDLPAPGGESFEAFQFRVLSKVNHLLEMTSLRSAAVVTHAGVMRVVLRSLYGLDERRAWEQTRDYCGFFRYQLGGPR